MRIPRQLSCFLALALTSPAFSVVTVKDAASAPGDFPFVVNKQAATIFVDKDDAEVVRIAAGMLAGDVELVAGVKPQVTTGADKASGPVVILGTSGKSGFIADLVKRGKLDTHAIEGKWESFVIQTIADPYPGVKSA